MRSSAFGALLTITIIIANNGRNRNPPALSTLPSIDNGRQHHGGRLFAPAPCHYYFAAPLTIDDGGVYF